MNAMKKLTLMAASLALLASCAQDTKALEKKLDEMNKNLVAMNGKLDQAVAAI